MSNYVIQDTSLVNIANAIRSKTGESALLTPAEMVAAINSITTGGGSSSSSGWINRRQWYETSRVNGSYRKILGNGNHYDCYLPTTGSFIFNFVFGDNASESTSSSTMGKDDCEYLVYYRKDDDTLYVYNTFKGGDCTIIVSFSVVSNSSASSGKALRITNNSTMAIPLGFGCAARDLTVNGETIRGYVWADLFYLDESFNEIGNINVPYLEYWNYNGANNAIIEKLYDKLTFEVLNGVFISAFASDLAAESNGVSDWRDKTILVKRTPMDRIGFDDMYRSNSTIKYPPKIAVASNATISSDAGIVVQTMFRNSHIVKISNDNVLQTFPLYTYSTPQQEMCCNCYYLREVPENFMIPVLKLSKSLPANAQRAITTSMYKNCYVLKEIRGMCYHLNTSSSNSVNLFGNTFNNCYTLHSLTFFTENDSDYYGAGNNTIDLSTAGYWESGTADADIFQYLEDDDKANAIVIRDASNATVANMGNKNSFAVGAAYATYNRQSAIETINTLPNASGNSQTGTIKFKSGAGSAYGTDYDMSNLSAEEIAVATAKGWTVALV